MTEKELWQTALGEIELNISRANFITWFKNTEINSKDGGIVTINTPNGFTKEWLENKYYKLILKALRNISQDVKEIKFSIGNKPVQKEEIPIRSKTEIQTSSITNEDQLNFEEFNINKETNLNPKYTFDTFIVGSFNELAQAAGRAVVNNLGSLYNPLFIYGGVGLGKTHLMQAIGNEINKNHPNKKVKYLSSEKYTSELVDAISKKGMKSFKEKYHDIDTLIIDDIQFIAGKEKTQEEFFHTFNSLYQKNKQIIISSDRPPKSISTLEERLRSRFEGGMIADIQPPDLETRLAILKSKIEEKKLNVPDDILNYISTNISSNVRELEGALNRIVAIAQINNTPPTLKKAQEILTNISSSTNKKSTNFKNIIKTVAEFYDVKTEDIMNRCRRKEIAYPRQIAMYLIRKELNNSYPYIGEKIGGRDHTTAMYACEKIGNKIKEDNSLQEEVSLILDKIYS